MKYPDISDTENSWNFTIITITIVPVSIDWFSDQNISQDLCACTNRLESIFDSIYKINKCDYTGNHEK